MNIRTKAIIGGLIVALLSFAAGTWSNRRSAEASAGARRILYYHDPMHPAYKSDKPGIAPDCGMQLEPVYSDGENPPAAATPNEEPLPGSVQIPADKQQLIGVRVERVQTAGAEHKLRILGRVAPDETSIYKIVAPVEGLVSEISDVTTGSVVEKNEVLASYISPDSIAFRNQQSYVNLLTTGGSSNPVLAGDTALRDFTRSNLKLLGMSDSQLAELEKTHKLTPNIRIVSPTAGVVLARNISAGVRFEKGFEFYRLADLRKIWVLADVFENDARLLRSVAHAAVHYQDKSLTARMSKVPPQFDPDTRALKVRLEVANSDYLLRPGMFVDVEFDVKMNAALVVPAGALLDSGLHKTVFVERGNGYFEPRSVETGARLGDSVVITGGLGPDERVVVSGNFLIDSESRFQRGGAYTLAAIVATPAAGKGKDPVCGMDVDTADIRYQVVFNGTTYTFCAEACMRKFKAQPGTYSNQGGPHSHGPA